ncbi:MAG: hypothetical protein K5668_05885 [Lachnospiraceae bacterium]|nr:hypothetical protein [Lachnospiraceae bacterium]
MFKRVLAIAGIVILVLMYLMTFILAIMNHPDTGRLLMASIVCTVFIPVMIHLLLMMNNARQGKSVYDEPYSYKRKEEGDKGETKTTEQ